VSIEDKQPRAPEGHFGRCPGYGPGDSASRSVFGAILAANSPTLDGQATTKPVFPVHRTVSMHTGHRSPELGQSPRKPLCHPMLDCMRTPIGRHQP